MTARLHRCLRLGGASIRVQLATARSTTAAPAAAISALRRLRPRQSQSRVCANSGRSPTARRAGQITTKRTFGLRSAATSGRLGSSTLRSDSIRFDQADFGAHLRLALRRALARTISFRMIAIKATLAGFPASTSWRYFALRSGLNRVATRAGM